MGFFGKAKKQVYLDNGATTRVDPEVVNAMLPHFTEKYGNASSLHSLGREARGAMEASREAVARRIGAEPKEIIFTSGGTESDNLAIQGAAMALKHRGKRIVTSTIEHPAVNNTVITMRESGFDPQKAPVGAEGFVMLDRLQDLVTKGTILVTVIHGNNEIGTVQDMKAISDIAHDRGALLHMDCVQSFGKVPINPEHLDLMSISAHKIHGPKGIGALYIKEGTPMKSMLFGGPHEFGRRPGTENVPLAAGFAKAAELMAGEDLPKIKGMRDRLVGRLLDEIPDSRLNGAPIADPNKRLVNNANMTFNYVEGEALLYKLDDAGILVSTGSACSSNSLKPSHVLSAIGLDHKIIHGTLRMTLGRFSAMDEVEYAADSVKAAVEELRRISPFREGFGEYEKTVRNLRHKGREGDR